MGRLEGNGRHGKSREIGAKKEPRIELAALRGSNVKLASVNIRISSQQVKRSPSQSPAVPRKPLYPPNLWAADMPVRPRRKRQHRGGPCLMDCTAGNRVVLKGARGCRHRGLTVPNRWDTQRQVMGCSPDARLAIDFSAKAVVSFPFRGSRITRCGVARGSRRGADGWCGHDKQSAVRGD